MTTTAAPDPFVGYLYSIAAQDNRAALSALRQGFINPMRALPYVARFLPAATERASAGHREENLMLLGGLFALHPEPGTTTLAGALRRLSYDSDSVELRFRAMIDSSREDLDHHLRHAVALSASKEIPLDFGDLLQAINGWSHESHFIQRRWAREFWAPIPETTIQSSTVSTNTSEET